MQSAGHHHDGGQGAVILDIGDDHGALMLIANAAMDGVEIEISPVGRDDRRQHVAVLRRPSHSGHVYAAIYSPLPAGDYRIWRTDGTVATVARVDGGRITRTSWPASTEDRVLDAAGLGEEPPDPPS